MFFANGNDRPDWGYTFSVPAGQTAIIMNFGVTMPSKAAAAAKSAALAGLTDAHALDCMTQGEISEVQNFVAKATPTVTVTAVPSPAPFASPVTFTATVAPPGGSTHTPTGTVSFFLDGQSPAVAVVPVGPSGMASFTTSGLGPGLHTVSANYSGDTNFSPASSTTSASDTITCTTTITGSHSGSLSVTSGSTCLSPGASVTGSVIVSAGASLVVDHGTVTGSISASNPNAIRLCGSTTGGSVTVIGAKGLVMIGGEALDECAPNRIGGSMIVLNNSGGLEVIGNHTGSPITAANNSGPGAVPADTSPLIAGNTTGSAPPG
jgi:hypothetical protein